MKKYCCIFFTLLAFGFFEGKTQPQDITSGFQTRITPPSPDAAAFAKYGTVPVSTYTGVPNIDIPLYNIKVRDLSLPISLSYHASGVTVEEESGWTGLGWTLNIGGVITRQIRGLNDLCSLQDGFHGTYWHSTNGSYKGYPYDPPIPSQTSIPQTYVTDVCQQNVDPEPDLFYFNFFGHTGSFILEKGQDINADYLVGTVLKAEKIDIRFNKPAKRWEITTPDGFRYYFGVQEIQEVKRTPGPPFGAILYPPLQDEVSYTSFHFYNSNDFNLTGWYLEKVISPLGEEVNYIYDLQQSSFCGSYGLRTPYGSVKNSFTDLMDKVVEWNPTGTNGTSCWGDLLVNHTIRDRTQTFTAHIYLKEIQFSQGSVSLSTSDRDDIRPANGAAAPENGMLQCTIGSANTNSRGPQKLDALVIKDKEGNPLKKFELLYSYFNNNATTNTYLFKRLKLTGFRECETQTNSCQPAHSFTYDESVALPSKYSRAIDFWGYYNGQDNNATRVPTGTYVKPGSTTGISVGDANRQPNGAYMKAGVLKKITYPTGGSTEFEFEPHDYYYYGAGTFELTDFESNMLTVTQLLTLGSSGGTSADLSQTLTLNDATQITLKRSLGFMPAIQQTSQPCCAASAFASPYNYSTATPYLEVRNALTNALVATYSLGEYASFMESCASSPCNSSQNSNHGAIFNNQGGFFLNAGTYVFTIKQKQDWSVSLTVEKSTRNPRVIPANAQGVYAKTAGGLRIKRMTVRNETNAITQIKAYDYTTTVNGQSRSSGRLMMFPSNHVLEGTAVASSNNPNDCSGTILKMYGKSNSVLPLGSSAQGSIVGYDKVTVKEGDNAENGSTEFYYANMEESVLPGAEFIYGTPSLVNTENGFLLKERVLNAQSTPVKETEYTPQRQLTKLIPGLAYRQTFTGAVAKALGNADLSCLSGQANLPFSVIRDRYVPSQIIEKAFDQVTGTPIIQTSDYTYDEQSHLQLSTKEVTINNGAKMKTQLTYTNEAAWIPSSISQNNYLFIPVNEQILKNGSVVAENKLSYLGYETKPLLDKIEKSINNNTLKLESSFGSYDEKGNLLQYRNKDGIINSFEWGYDRSLPIAKALNAANQRLRQLSDQTSYLIWSPGQFNAQTATFIQERDGDMTITFGYGAYPGNTNNYATANYTISGPQNSSGTLCVSNYAGGCSNSSITLSNMPAGTYTIVMGYTCDYSLSFSGSFKYKSSYFNTLKEFFVESFEESSVGVPAPSSLLKGFTGRKMFYNGQYTVPFLKPNSRKYTLTYFLDGQLVQQDYTDNMVIDATNKYLDEVRVFPSDAFLTTYTYKPLVGPITECDANSRVVYYEYDPFGRLMLMKDQDGNILKKFCYNFQGQVSQCE